METTHENLRFTDADVVNIDDFLFSPKDAKTFLVYNEYGTLAVVFADHEQDALDIAADEDKLKGHRMSPEAVAEAEKEGHADETISYLGNASEEYDLTNIGCIRIPTPPVSFAALFAAQTSS